jgi:hypothetical protein
MYKRKVVINGKTVVARMGCVHWKDAMSVIKSDGQFFQPPDCIALGFVCSVGDVMYVISGFTNGEVDDYLILPKDWKVSVYYFGR